MSHLSAVILRLTNYLAEGMKVNSTICHVTKRTDMSQVNYNKFCTPTSTLLFFKVMDGLSDTKHLSFSSAVYIILATEQIGSWWCVSHIGTVSLLNIVEAHRGLLTKTCWSVHFPSTLTHTLTCLVPCSLCFIAMHWEWPPVHSQPFCSSRGWQVQQHYTEGFDSFEPVADTFLSMQKSVEILSCPDHGISMITDVYWGSLTFLKMSGFASKTL